MFYLKYSPSYCSFCVWHESWSNNTGLQGFVVEKLWVVFRVIFEVDSESGIRISLSRQDFEIFEVIYSKNGVFRYFWGYVQGARNFFVTSDFCSQRYGHSKFWHLSEQPYEHSHWLFGAYHSAFENLSWKFVLAGFDSLCIRIYSQKQLRNPRVRAFRERNRLIS